MLTLTPHHFTAGQTKAEEREVRCWKLTMPVIPGFGRLRQEDCCELTDGLSYTDRPCLKTTPSQEKRNIDAGYSVARTSLYLTAGAFCCTDPDPRHATPTHSHTLAVVTLGTSLSTHQGPETMLTALQTAQTLRGTGPFQDCLACLSHQCRKLLWHNRKNRL